jgi:hypothetical protein
MGLSSFRLQNALADYLLCEVSFRRRQRKQCSSCVAHMISTTHTALDIHGAVKPDWTGRLSGEGWQVRGVERMLRDHSGEAPRPGWSRL